MLFEGTSFVFLTINFCVFFRKSFPKLCGKVTAPLKVNGFYVKFSSLIYLDCLESLACLLSVCNELEQIHLRRDMKGLEVGCLDQISYTCDPICRLSKYPFVSAFYGAYLKAACGTGGTGSNEEKRCGAAVHRSFCFPPAVWKDIFQICTYILSQRVV